MKKTIVSVIGKDTVGIIAKVSGICAECNVNIVDINQSVMQDMFAMVMLTDIENRNCHFSEFCDKMNAAGEELSVEIRVMREEIFNSMHRV